MTTILLLFLLGIVLLVLDVFVLGVFLSVAGTIAFLAAIAEAFKIYGVGGGLAAFAVGVVLLGTALYVEYVILPKTRFGRKFFLHAEVKGGSQPSADMPALVGREGVTITPLVPTGQIEIDGRRYEAQSLDGHVDRGQRVKVGGSQNFSLTVTKL
jgi:membrane-bound ClpP family serine protease